MSIKLKAYTSNHKKIFREAEIEALYGAKFEYLDELPFDLRPGEILLLDLDEITDDIIEKAQYTRVKFVTLVDTLKQHNLNRLLPIGGNLFAVKGTPFEDFIEILTSRIHQMEMFKILHLVSHTDVELFRFILRAGNGEKSKLSELIFGSTSESTMDVNLSRLRKKLRDPNIGDDFFRIITKSGRLYVVSRLTNYEIPKHLLEKIKIPT
ncbi:MULTISPECIES: hypothetical protein [unclassified Halobacteriovorax]|uniref:hypothetical protein n=1 Tax=unclassified Halobacteriovorax TaxID=2639665 RepID=UPI00399A896C